MTIDLRDYSGALRKRLRARQGQYRLICEMSGLDYSWLSKFSRGVIRDPGIDRLSRLAEAIDSLDEAGDVVKAA